MSLTTISQTLVGTARHKEAAEAARDGLTVIVAFAETQPQVFGDIAPVLGRNHIEACKQAGSAPDVALLHRVANTLVGGGAQQAASEHNSAPAALTRSVPSSSPLSGQARLTRH